jgi:hypothetical protein
MKKSTQNTCPRCGQQKYYTAQLCINCHTANTKQQRSKHPKDACPKCGGQKLLASRVCRGCFVGRELPITPYLPSTKSVLPSPDWACVTQDFLLQFAGILLSEGTIATQYRPTGSLFISLTIQLRIDDLPALQFIQERLGGAVRVEERKGHSNMARWLITKRADVHAILQAVRPLVLIDMKKVREVDAALEYFAWRDELGYERKDPERAADYARRIAELKRYSA